MTSEVTRNVMKGHRYSGLRHSENKGSRHVGSNDGMETTVSVFCPVPTTLSPPTTPER